MSESTKLACPGGHEIVTQSTATGVAGAWLNLDGPDKYLCLVVEPPRGQEAAQRYIGYRDGVDRGGDKFALSVKDGGEVMIQLITVCEEGHGHTHFFTLAQLEEMVRRCKPTPPPA